MKTELQMALANQRVILKDARVQLSVTKQIVKELLEAVVAEKSALRTAKAAEAASKALAREEKERNKIARAQERLDKLMAKIQARSTPDRPVGVRALKAARKPGPVTVLKG
jgi:predicted hydrolase (HD superfamily)